MNRPLPGRRIDYPHFETLQMRWADTDIYGHMNNAVHYLLFDTAVQNILIRNDLLDLDRSENVFLVAASGCDYFDEIEFGDRIEAGVRIIRLGITSVTYEIGIFRNGNERSAATGRFTHVNVCRESRRPVELPDRAREVLQPLANIDHCEVHDWNDC